MKISWKYFALAFILILLNISASAQCAMCKATAESATENVDKGIGEGLNAGIVYLMLIPYVLLATVALVFFRKKIVGLFRS
jgi:amino acid transporter